MQGDGRDQRTDHQRGRQQVERHDHGRGQEQFAGVTDAAARLLARVGDGPYRVAVATSATTPVLSAEIELAQ